MAILVVWLAVMFQPVRGWADDLGKTPTFPPGSGESSLDKVDTLVLEELAQEGQSDYFIWLTEKADLSPAAQLPTKEDKGRFVYDALRTVAEGSQREIREYLDQQGLSYRPFYISNKIFVYQGSQKVALDLAARDDVERITANHTIQAVEPSINPGSPESVEAIEPNITFVNADEVWAMGITGRGIVLAGNDTGIQWDHPALKSHYRGWNGFSVDHDYNWWDATRTYPLVPGDGYGHGTHVTGTMVGDDGAENRIGVAPGAKTIHCKNMDDGGSGTDATFTECLEWDLAPWDLNGNNPRPDLAPDVVNNSWGHKGGEYNQFRDEIAALQAAGILVEVSAGNEGDETPACGTLRSPGDYAEVLTTGSVSRTGDVLPGTLTIFSSRGPSTLDGGYFPDVLAPGEIIRSSVPGNRYAAWSGTSMAGPHVSGLVGLIWSANPILRGRIAETVQIITSTAVPLTGQLGASCGGNYTSGPNNDWGYGTIDALAAVQLAMGDVGILQGTVVEGDLAANPGTPIPGVVVEVTLNSVQKWAVTTDVQGQYRLAVMIGTHTIQASAFDYLPAEKTGIPVTKDMTETVVFDLQPAVWYTVTGTVTDARTGWPLYAHLQLVGNPVNPVPPYNEGWTDPHTGNYSLTLPEGITYTFSVEAWVAGYQGTSRDVGPLVADRVEDFTLGVDESSCVAPGYQPEAEYFEDFEAGNGGFVIEGNTSWAWGLPESGPGRAHSGFGAWGTNLTGDYGNGEEGYLVSPEIDLRALAGEDIQISWWQWLKTESDYDFASLEVTSNGGITWTMVYTVSGDVDLSWLQHTLMISPTYAVQNFRLRFQFTSDYSERKPGWYVDDVMIWAVGENISCNPKSGGLVVGNVYDANTGWSLAGARITSDADSATISQITDNPGVADGFFTLFVPAGNHVLTATLAGGYQPDERWVTVVLSDAVEQDFHLPAGKLEVIPLGLDVTTQMGLVITAQVTLTNQGGFPASFVVYETNPGITNTGVTDFPWLSVSPLTGTIPAGSNSPIDIYFDANLPEVTQPGVYQASLKVDTDTPYPEIEIPVTMTVSAAPTMGRLTGKVYGLGYCDANPQPLEDATVLIGDTTGFTLTTGVDGAYTIWLESGNSPYTVTAIAEGHQIAEQIGIDITPQITTTLDVNLRVLQPCFRVSPVALDVQVGLGYTRSVTLTLKNDGAWLSPFSLTDVATSTISLRETLMPNSWRVQLYEGFESGSMPPLFWTQVISDNNYISNTWNISTKSPHIGNYLATVSYDPALHLQDEWLLSPEVMLDEAKLSFWTYGSLYWCRDVNDNCDLNVWIVVGDVGGGDDIFVGKGDDFWTSSYTWSLASFDLTLLLPSGPMRIGFQYSGRDGAMIALDDVFLDGWQVNGVPWFQSTPVSGTLGADSSMEFEVVFVTLPTMQAGDVWQGMVRIHSEDPMNPEIMLPVTMRVVEYRVYLPLVLGR